MPRQTSPGGSSTPKGGGLLRECPCIQAQFAGEVNFWESDVPGTSSNPEDLTNVEEKNGSGNWKSQPWANDWHWASDICSWMNHANIDSSTHFQIWTDPLSHSGC